MKTTPFLIGVLALGLWSCNEDEKPASTDEASLKRREASARLDRFLEARESGALKAEAAKEAKERAAAEPPPPLPEVVARKPVKADTPPVPTREELQAKREKDQAERVARVKESMSSRLQESDANGDGFIARDEISGIMAHRFDDHDSNGDGFLDANEQTAMMEKMAERMSEMSRHGSSRRGPGKGGFGKGRGGRGGGRGR